MSSVLKILLILIYTPTLWAIPNWVKLTDKKTQHCSEQAPCTLVHDKNNQRFRVTFDLKKEDNKLLLSTVNIVGPDKKKSQFSDLENFHAHFDDEEFKLFAVDLNNDGFLDLALEASLSNRMGPMYYYWVYDSKKKSFVQTTEQIEELSFNAKGKLEGAASGDLYTINKDFKIQASSGTK